MTAELQYLALSAVLTALLWLPYALGLALTGGVNAQYYRDTVLPELPEWVKRCNRAHINAVESFAPFAAMVLIAHVAGISTEMTAFWAALFFFARLAHAVVFWLGIPYVRSLAFAAGLLSTLGLFYELMQASPAT